MATFELGLLHAHTPTLFPPVCGHGYPRPSSCEHCIVETVALGDRLALDDAWSYAKVAGEPDLLDEAVGILERSPWHVETLSALLSTSRTERTPAAPRVCFVSDTKVAFAYRFTNGRWSARQVARVQVDAWRLESGWWRVAAYTSELSAGPHVDRQFHLWLATDGRRAIVQEGLGKRLIENPLRFPAGRLAEAYVYLGTRLEVRAP